MLFQGMWQHLDQDHGQHKRNSWEILSLTGALWAGCGKETYMAVCDATVSVRWAYRKGEEARAGQSPAPRSRLLAHSGAPAHVARGDNL